MPGRKYTDEVIIESLIDRFYGVPLIDIEKEHGVKTNTMQDIIRKRINKKKKTPTTYYKKAFQEALVQLDVTEEEYFKEIARHISNERAENTRRRTRHLSKKSHDEILSVLKCLFEKPTSTSEIARKTGVDKTFIHRIRSLESYKEITQEYIELHQIENPETFLENKSHRKSNNGYPVVTDELVKLFFYSYMAGASRERAAAAASISPMCSRSLLNLTHAKKRDLMIELIISEGLTPQAFLSYVKKKTTRQAVRSREKTAQKKRKVNDDGIKIGT